MKSELYRTQDSVEYRDLNKNGRMDPYEDPRIPIEERIDDLLSQMTIEEKAGMLFINGAAVNADGSIEDNPDQPWFAIGTVIDFNRPRCGCGNYGCLEAYESGPAVAAIGMKAVAQGLTTRLSEMCKYDLNRITPKLIAQAADEGDEIAKDIFEKAGFYLSIAAANICSTIGPRRIIIAGGVSQAGELLLEPIRCTLRKRVTVMPIDQVEVVRSQLGNNAGVIGVARWAADVL